MARKPRVEYEGAIYHVMNRGDRGEAIFGGDSDRELFVSTLGETCGKTGWSHRQVRQALAELVDLELLAQRGGKESGALSSGIL